MKSQTAQPVLELPYLEVFIIFFAVGVFIVIAYTVRLWLVQTAILDMRDDLNEIKNYLRNQGSNRGNESTQGVGHRDETQPAEEKNTPAQQPSGPLVSGKFLAVIIPIFVLLLIGITALGMLY